MADALLLPPPLAGDERFRALGRIAARISDIDLSPLLVYLVDAVNATALPHLAEQFHVMGDEGWNLAGSDAERRTLIKAAIELHRYKGTPWAIKTALAKIGYPDSELIEYHDYSRHWTAAGGHTLNGDWLLDGGVGLVAPAGIPLRRVALSHWAEYAIRLNVGTDLWTQEQQRAIRRMAMMYAPVRSHLKSLLIWASLEFDASVRLTGYRGRVHTRLDRCRRLSAHNRTTLDGCWLLDGDDAPLMLASWPLDGRRLHGRTPAGRPLNAGAMSLRTRLRQRIRSSLGGSRTRTVTLGGRFARLDGRTRLSESTLGDGWTLASGRSLGDSTLDRIAAPRLDGTWLLGGETGQPGLWFTGTLTIRRNGITTTEAI
ncbi:P2-related tail formation protein [Microvirgula sp. AG722]|uniref:phage tail protein n=1 Tax=Microvirgula sp. AG722 TaxID=2183901 RepID=UPI000DC5BD43|nr:phage tail protein [Microvirgula sp. AG722]RAS18949.1 P2-related tail formation protein [Microvirgula sp. AG722]